MTKILFVDIKGRADEEVVLEKIAEISPDEIVSLSPFAVYLLERNNLKFSSLHDFLSVQEFRDKILVLYSQMRELIESIFSEANLGFGLMFDLCRVVNYFFAMNQIEIIAGKKEAIYLTDICVKKELSDHSDIQKLLSNQILVIPKGFKLIQLEPPTIFWQELQKLFFKLKTISSFGHLKKIVARRTQNFQNIDALLKYDWSELVKLLQDIDQKVSSKSMKPEKLVLFKNGWNQKLEEFSKNVWPHNYEIVTLALKAEFVNYEKVFSSFDSLSSAANFFVFADNGNTFLKAQMCKHLGVESFFFQHGSYLYRNVFIEFSEVIPATFNFVINDFTHNYFESMGAKDIVTVGSKAHCYEIVEKPKEYDFVYITQGHDYYGKSLYVDFPDSTHSFDGYELYKRHEALVKLFGQKHPDKKICIRMHPVVKGDGYYVPMDELAEKFPNVKIDFSTPIKTLVETSKSIISDYFTTEFLNFNIHFARDIILFSGSPTPIPNDLREDIGKMFLCCDNLSELASILDDFEKIVAERVKEQKIIEFYSSKKLDTESLVRRSVSEKLKIGLNS